MGLLSSDSRAEPAYTSRFLISYNVSTLPMPSHWTLRTNLQDKLLNLNILNEEIEVQRE